MIATTASCRRPRTRSIPLSVYGGVEDFHIDHFAVGLEQGNARRRFAGSFGEPGGKVVRIDPPGRGPGLGELEITPLCGPTGPVRLVVGPAHEVVDVFPKCRHAARLNIEDVRPGVACPVICRPGVPVLGLLLDEHDLQGLPSKLKKAYRGSGAPQTRADDDNSTELAEVFHRIT